MQSDARIAIIGAGKTGRGFIARLLEDHNIDFILIDKDMELVRKIKNGYTVGFFEGREPCKIIPYDSVCISDPLSIHYLRNAEIVFVSVGINNLPEVGKYISGKLNPGAFVFVCENGLNASRHIESNCKEKNGILFIDTAVFCTTIEGQGVNILSENINTLPYAAHSMTGTISSMPFLERINDFPSFMTRKLFTYNAAAAIISYNGWLLGYKDFGEAANDHRILTMLENYYEEIGKALCAEFGYTEESQRAFAEASLKKFTNRYIKDTITRNGRDPKRKLAPEERIIGPLRLIMKYGGNTEVMEQTVASCIKYDADPLWKQFIKTKSYEYVLCEICKINDDEEIFKSILKRIYAL